MTARAASGAFVFASLIGTASADKWSNCCDGSDGYLNGFDGWMQMSLYGAAEAMTGLQSYHDNGAEDRRWKVIYRDLPAPPRPAVTNPSRPPARVPMIFLAC